MNNLDTLWAYIKKLAPPEGIEGYDDSQGKFRDLKQYHQKKVSRWESGIDRQKRWARELISDPLLVCNLRPEGVELCKPDGSNKLAVAAMLLAMSIVLNIDYQTLERAKKILEQRAIRDLEVRLKSILSKGDLVQSTLCPKLELKNFGSVSLGFERVEAQYKAAAENAFLGARALLTTINQNLVAFSTSIPERFKPTFNLYFGDPAAKVDMGELHFDGGARPMLTGSQTRFALVRAVLDCVWQGLETKTVRLYFGGGSVITNVEAYTTSVRDGGRVNVHLAIDFFSKHDEQVIKGGDESSRAGVLIHEFTHALAGTLDVDQAFSPGQCRELARRDKRALTNAQNYASFVEEAFG